MQNRRKGELGGWMRWSVVWCAGIMWFLLTPLASAQSVVEFYTGKTIFLIVGAEVGGDYDRTARVLARFLGGNLPGRPSVIVQNMPGGTGSIAANFLYAGVPRDGSVIGHVNQSIALLQATGGEGIRYQADQFSWIGSFSRVVGMTIVSEKTGVKTVEDAKRVPVVLGSTSIYGTMTTYPAILNNALGTKFQIVLGYRGGSSVELAMERGEISGRGAHNWQGIKRHPSWLRNKEINVLVQFAHNKEVDTEGIPTILEFAQDDIQRSVFELISADTEMGMPFLAPPNIPVLRLQAIRRAFELTIENKDFLDALKASGLDLFFVKGDSIDSVVRKILSTSASTVELAQRWGKP